MTDFQINAMSREADEKAIFCELNSYLFDADLMRGLTGELWRNISLDKLY